MIKSFSDKKFPVVLADFPWFYYGNPYKDQAAGKHYPMMSDKEIYSSPVTNILLPQSILFLWVTGPKLDVAFKAIEAWGLHYRGIAFSWIKTNKASEPINGQGGRASLIKHAEELVLWASFQKKGRPLPIKDEGMASFILEPEEDFTIDIEPRNNPSFIFESRPNNIHSRKPETVQDRIERLLDGPYLELFARRQRPNWECFGNEINSETKPESEPEPEPEIPDDVFWARY